MTLEEARETFLNRGWIKAEGGTYFDGDKWREAVMVISDYLQKEQCEDCISRQAAIEAINRLDIPEDMCVFEILSHIELELGTLPSAQPQLPEWAKKVEEYRQSAPQHIHNPLAWALYQVWKEITAEGGHDEH